MVNSDMLKCALGMHKYGGMLHDDMLDRWIKICRHCGTIVEVDAPRDENGEPIDSHVWLRMENVRSEKELGECIERTLNALSLRDD